MDDGSHHKLTVFTQFGYCTSISIWILLSGVKLVRLNLEEGSPYILPLLTNRISPYLNLMNCLLSIKTNHQNDHDDLIKGFYRPLNSQLLTWHNWNHVKRCSYKHYKHSNLNVFVQQQNVTLYFSQNSIKSIHHILKFTHSNTKKCFLFFLFFFNCRFILNLMILKTRNLCFYHHWMIPTE